MASSPSRNSRFKYSKNVRPGQTHHAQSANHLRELALSGDGKTIEVKKKMEQNKFGSKFNQIIRDRNALKERIKKQNEK